MSYLGIARRLGTRMGVDEDVRLVEAIYRTVSPKFPFGVNKMVV